MFMDIYFSLNSTFYRAVITLINEIKYKICIEHSPSIKLT